MAGAAQQVSLEELARWAGKTAQDLQGVDLMPPLRTCAVLMTAETKMNFDRGTTPDGTPWAPLKHPRANSKGADKPLRDKGLLMASVVGQGQGHIEQLDQSGLVWGTNLEYAAVHQYGASILVPERTRAKPWVLIVEGGRKVFTRRIKAHNILIPARPFLGLTQRIVRKVSLIFGEYIGNLLGK